MWRERAASRQGESAYLEQALESVLHDIRFVQNAEQTLAASAAAEPLIAESLLTPQSLPYHAEGPFLSAHLRRMLTVLYAVSAGAWPLRNIEEFRRLRGYEGEIDELEETIRERAAFFEVFILCHDAAKRASAMCVADPGTPGIEHGFVLPIFQAGDDALAAAQATLRERYLVFYREFAKLHSGKKPEEIQAIFFETYGIKVHYHGHERMIHAPVYRSLLARLSASRRLPESDIALLEDLIAHHLQPLTDFDAVRPERLGRYLAIAEDRGYDADDFIDLFQAALFLDVVTGSRRREGKHSWQDPSSLIFFLQSEHAHAPWKREAKEVKRKEKDKRERHKRFRDVGLDGVALLDLLHLTPGPTFGALLKKIHAAIGGKGPMPVFPAPIAKELTRRVEAYDRFAQRNN